MKINYLPEALSEVSNEHIEEATYVKRSDCKTHRKRYGIFAACLTLAFFVYNGDHSNIKFNEQDAITLYPTNHSWFTNILSNFLLDYVNNSKLKRSSNLHL